VTPGPRRDPRLTAGGDDPVQRGQPSATAAKDCGWYQSNPVARRDAAITS
jgi:hypothetical protein